MWYTWVVLVDLVINLQGIGAQGVVPWLLAPLMLLCGSAAVVLLGNTDQDVVVQVQGHASR